MDRFAHGDLTIEPEKGSDDRTRLVWKGRSNERQPGDVLGPYLEGVLDEASGAEQGVELDFRPLEHVNSSTISVIVRLIQQARGKSVPLVLLYDDSQKWQKLNFDALGVFDKQDGLLELRAAPADK